MYNHVVDSSTSGLMLLRIPQCCLKHVVLLHTISNTHWKAGKCETVYTNDAACCRTSIANFVIGAEHSGSLCPQHILPSASILLDDFIGYLSSASRDFEVCREPLVLRGHGSLGGRCSVLSFQTHHSLRRHLGRAERAFLRSTPLVTVVSCHFGRSSSIVWTPVYDDDISLETLRWPNHDSKPSVIRRFVAQCSYTRSCLAQPSSFVRWVERCSFTTCPSNIW